MESKEKHQKLLQYVRLSAACAARQRRPSEEEREEMEKLLQELGMSKEEAIQEGSQYLTGRYNRNR